MLAAAKAAFLPEFLNRIDEIVTFRPLTAEQVERICALICERRERAAGRAARHRLDVDAALVTRLAREGFDEAFGARPLQRHVRRTLEKELTRAILAGELPEGARVRATDGGDGTIAIAVEPAAEPLRLAA
jgi:ATP-dependent Clp protease ATP-binding subunit ClpC